MLWEGFVKKPIVIFRFFPTKGLWYPVATMWPAEIFWKPYVLKRATLNARASILAAANPIGGRYDRSKSLRQNINLSSPIVSRFDLFFIVVDECDEIVDYAIARRILDLHKDGDVATHKVYSSDDVQRYILFAKLWNPKLTEAAVECLVTFYKQLRLRETGGSALSSRRVTVRQLESLIRLSEAVARMYCLADITETHVKEAFRLLCKSIIRVEQPDVEFDQQRLDDAVANGHANRLADDVEKAENGDEQQVMIGKTALPQKLKLTFEEYRKLANLLVFHIRQQEELNDDTGIRRSELISWYISEIQDELATEADLVYRKTLVEKVIDRLIKPKPEPGSVRNRALTLRPGPMKKTRPEDRPEKQKTERKSVSKEHSWSGQASATLSTDNILIQLTQTSSEEMGGLVEESDPIMVVHPNYVLEDL
uniref:MCM domain-containing protein n=1 Tax=Romanomermis culicivorax TaxID=13658 RepID=A0A915JL23_ROMCU